jgi:TPR repeat protein
MEEKSLQDLLADAKAGDSAAQFTLGTYYWRGVGVRRNRKSAIKWWKLATEQGHTEAMFRLGMAYKLGTGVEHDKQEAARLLRIAADQGFAQAQFHLGLSYSRGDGINQNKEEALMLWKLAAEQGYGPARFAIGKMYYEGDGVDQNYDEAVKWLSDSEYWMGKCYLLGHGVEQNISKTIALWESIADGSYTMYIELAHLYGDGIYMEPDYLKAAYWWSQAASDDTGNPANGIPEALYELAQYYYEGKGVEKDHQRALDCFKWATKSYERHDGVKAYAEKVFCKEPDRIPQEIQKYYDAYKMAIKLGDKTVIRKLRSLARIGDAEAKNVLDEFGIEVESVKTATSPSPRDVPVTAGTPETPKTKPLVSVSVGETLLSQTWGDGVVVKVDNQIVWVEFADVGQKAFINPQAFDEGFLLKK